MPLAFLNYRRSDAQQAAQALYAQLGIRFGPSKTFLDVGAILPGANWPKRIRTSLAHANVVLAIIGPRWLTAANEYGQRRIDDSADWVRSELIYAIENKKPIIPVLVAGATAMPVPAALPIPIQPLLEHQWIQLRDENWDYDLERLTGILERGYGFVDNQATIQLPSPQKSIVALHADEIDTVLQAMPGWTTVESVVPREYPMVRQELRRIFKFDSFEAAIDFMKKNAGMISAMHHHPRWENQWTTVTVYLTTWDIGSRISENDIALAKALESAYQQRAK